MLSDYGARRPQYDALQALLVLGAYGRGGAEHEFQLHHAAGQMLSGAVPRAQLKAFATGKLGQTHTPAARLPGLGARRRWRRPDRHLEQPRRHPRDHRLEQLGGLRRNPRGGRR